MEKKKSLQCHLPQNQGELQKTNTVQNKIRKMNSSSLEENKQYQDEQQQQHEVIICAACSKPLFSFESILSDKIDVFSKAVYTYQIEDVLPDHGIEGGCHLYSATNPGAKRFDVFRVKTVVSDGKDHDAEPQVLWNYELTIRCEKHKYTDLHTWFPGYSWCMTVCGNCHTHIGWGFSPTDPGDDLQADEVQNEDEQDEQEEDEEEHQDENKKQETRKNKNKKRQRPPRNIRHPTFVGVIFGHIRARSMPVPEWQRHLQHLASVSVECRLDLLRSAWPILDDRFRTAILKRIFQLRQDFLQEQNSIAVAANRFKPDAAFTFSYYFFLTIEGRDLQYSLLNAAAYIERRKRRRAEEEGETNVGAIDREVIRIPGFRSTLTAQEEEYLLEPNEDEDFLDTLDSRELFVEWNRVVVVGTNNQESSVIVDNDEVMKEWENTVAGLKTKDEARIKNRRSVVGAIMILNFYERWCNQYLFEDGTMRINLEETDDQEQHEDEEDFDDMQPDEEGEEEEAENQNENDQHDEENAEIPQHEEELPLIQVEIEQPASNAPRTRNEIQPLWKFLLITMIPELEILLC